MSVEDAATPEPGTAFFYLVAYEDGPASGFGTVSALWERVVSAGGCPEVP